MPETSVELFGSEPSSAAVSGDVRPRTPNIAELAGASLGAILSEATAREQPAPPRSKHWLVRRLGDRWTLPIIDTLRHGPMRFAKLKKALEPISQRMLTLSLKGLERDGLVHRKSYPGLPPCVTYELTSAGMSLLDMLEPFDNWLEANRRHILEANMRFTGRH